LISHAGSLENLGKTPASTIQILGAEKALFKALKTKANAPKYGLVYHTKLIEKTENKEKNKGKISRYLENKVKVSQLAQMDHVDLSEKIENQDKDQILEAEKALFQAVKKSEEGDAPKYGLVFHDDDYKPPEKKDQNS